MVATSPAFVRNKDPILGALESVWPASGRVLEVGSGPGQHVALFAQRFGGLTFFPTERDRTLFVAISHHVAEAGVHNVRPPAFLDLDDDKSWPDGDEGFDAVLAINVLHMVGERSVARFFELAGRVLKPGGAASAYECFTQGGQHTAESNAKFDAWLRETSPGRVHAFETVCRFAEENGLPFEGTQALPANNQLVTFRRI